VFHRIRCGGPSDGRSEGTAPAGAKAAGGNWPLERLRQNSHEATTRATAKGACQRVATNCYKSCRNTSFFRLSILHALSGARCGTENSCGPKGAWYAALDRLNAVHHDN